MTPTLFPSVFTIEIGGTPTVTFEAKSLREANEICNAPWLREDFASAHFNGAPLWDGKAPLRARMGYADEIATFLRKTAASNAVTKAKIERANKLPPNEEACSLA